MVIPVFLIALLERSKGISLDAISMLSKICWSGGTIVISMFDLAGASFPSPNQYVFVPCCETI